MRVNKLLLRFGLLVAYILAALLLVVFFGAAGHGSYAPGAILYGWGIVPWQLNAVRGEVGFLLVPVLYLVCYFAFATWFARSPVPLGVHAGGVVVAIMNVQHTRLAERAWLAMSYIVSVALAVGFIWCDQRLLRHRQVQKQS